MLRILGVDDDPALLENGKRSLNETGLFTVDTATSAGTAMQMHTAAPYDLIFCDYPVPEMNGIPLVKALRDQGVELENNRTLTDLLALATGSITEEEIAQRNAIENVTEAFAAGEITTWEYYAALEAIDRMARDGSGAIGSLSAALSGLPREVRTDVLINTYRYETVAPRGTQPGPGGNGPLAAGGLAHAAAGASINTPALVGERGPEVAFMPNGTRIISHHDAIKALGNESGNGMDANKLLTAFRTAIKELKTGQINYNLSMPTTANPQDVGMAFEVMRAYGGN